MANQLANSPSLDRIELCQPAQHDHQQDGLLSVAIVVLLLLFYFLKYMFEVFNNIFTVLNRFSSHHCPNSMFWFKNMNVFFSLQNNPNKHGMVTSQFL